MSATFFLYPKQKFDPQEIRDRILRYDGALPDPTDPFGLIIAESRAEATDAARYLMSTPPRNPWKVLLHIEPDIIHVYREATQEVLDYFNPILRTILIPSTARVTDDEGRNIDMSIREGIENYLLR